MSVLENIPAIVVKPMTRTDFVVYRIAFYSNSTGSYYYFQPCLSVAFINLGWTPRGAIDNSNTRLVYEDCT